LNSHLGLVLLCPEKEENSDGKVQHSREYI
jgi:hypothetical protein